MSIHCDNPHLLNETKVDAVQAVLVFAGLLLLMIGSLVIGAILAIDAGISVWPRLGIIFIVNVVIDLFVVLWVNRIFRVLTWSNEGITLTHSISQRGFHIAWDAASIVYDKNKEYIIYGEKGKQIKIKNPLSARNEERVARFVRQKWNDFYSQSYEKMRDQEQCLWERDDYKASISGDRLWVNKKSLPLSKIQYIWKENMDDYEKADHQIFILKVQNLDDLAVHVDFSLVDVFLRYLDENISGFRYFDYLQYMLDKRRKESLLSEDEKAFCARRHKYRVGNVEMGLLGAILGMPFLFQGDEIIAWVFGVTSGWIYWLIFFIVIGVLALFKKAGNKLITSYRRSGSVETF